MILLSCFASKIFTLPHIEVVEQPLHNLFIFFLKVQVICGVDTYSYWDFKTYFGSVFFNLFFVYAFGIEPE